MNSKHVANLAVYNTSHSQFNLDRIDTPTQFDTVQATDTAATIQGLINDFDTCVYFPATVVTLNGSTPAITSVYLKSQNIVYMWANGGSNSNVLYWDEDLQLLQTYVLSGTPSTIDTAINAITSQTGAPTLSGANAFTGTNSFSQGITAGANGVTAITPLTTTPVGTVTIKEYSDGRDVTAVLTLTNFVVGALAGAGAALGIGNIVAAMPAGQELEIAYGADSLVFTCAGTAVTGVFGIGSVIASGAVSVLSGTATFQDRMAGTAATTGASGGAAVSNLSVATAGALTGIAINTAAKVKNFFLNFAGTWNANNTGNLTCRGTIVLRYSIM